MSKNPSRSIHQRVLHILMAAPLPDLTAMAAAERLGMSESTLRRRLRAEHTCYRQLREEVRRYRCFQALAKRQVGSKALAAQLGFQQTNSFYRIFPQWSGTSWRQYKRENKPKKKSSTKPIVGRSTAL